MNSKNTIDMTTGSLIKKLLLFAVPLMFTSLLQLVFNAVDIIVVGQFTDPSISAQAVASIGSSAVIIALLVNLFLGLSTGATVVIAKYFGAKNDKDLSETVHTAITLSLIAGAILSVVGVLMAERILVWMNVPRSVLGYGAKYLKIYFSGNIVTMLYNFGSAILHAVGDTRRPLIFLAIAGVANIGFNFFFVLVLDMTVEGVALGTIISQAISALLVLICLSKEKGALRFEIKKLAIHADKLKMILRLGIPAGLQASLFSLANIFIQSAINGFGDITMAGSSASANIEALAQVFMYAFHHASISCVSQNMGAKQLNRIKKTAILAPTLSTAIGIIIGVVFTIFAKYALRLYLTDETAIAEGLKRMRIIFPTFFICGIMDTFSGVLRGAGFAVYPTVVNFLGCAFRIVWIYTVFAKNRVIEVLYLLWPISWTLVIISLVIFYFAYARKSVTKSCGVSLQDSE